RALERARACSDAAGVWVPDRAVHTRAVTLRDGASDVLGKRYGAIVRSACSRPTVAHLGEHRRFRDLSERSHSGSTGHSNRAGAQRRNRRIHRNLPRARHLAWVAGPAAGERPYASLTGIAGGLDANCFANSRRRRPSTWAREGAGGLRLLSWRAGCF